MNRFINLLFANKTDVYTHRTNDSAKVERDRTTERDAIRSRYCLCDKQKAHHRRTLRCGRCILQEPREETETGKSGKSPRSTQESTREAIKLKLSLPLFFYSIIYNPSFWTLMFIIDTTFFDEITAFMFSKMYVIMQTTQSLLSLGGIG